MNFSPAHPGNDGWAGRAAGRGQHGMKNYPSHQRQLRGVLRRKNLEPSSKLNHASRELGLWAPEWAEPWSPAPQGSPWSWLPGPLSSAEQTPACTFIPLRDPHFSCPGLLDFITSNEPIRGWAKAITIAGPSGKHSQSQAGMQPHCTPPTASLPHNERGKCRD